MVEGKQIYLRANSSSTYLSKSHPWMSPDADAVNRVLQLPAHLTQHISSFVGKDLCKVRASPTYLQEEERVRRELGESWGR